MHDAALIGAHGGHRDLFFEIPHPLSREPRGVFQFLGFLFLIIVDVDEKLRRIRHVALYHLMNHMIQRPEALAGLADQEAAVLCMDTEIDRIGVFDVINGHREAQPFQQGLKCCSNFLDLGFHACFVRGLSAAPILRALY